MKCDFCGKQSGFNVYTRNGKSFCSVACEINFFTTPNDRKKQKHEEIKRMAFEIFLAWNTPGEPTVNPATAWENAEDFYNFAKKKEGEMIDDSTKNES